MSKSKRASVKRLRSGHTIHCVVAKGAESRVVKFSVLDRVRAGEDFLCVKAEAGMGAIMLNDFNIGSKGNKHNMAFTTPRAANRYQKECVRLNLHN